MTEPLPPPDLIDDVGPADGVPARKPSRVAAGIAVLFGALLLAGLAAFWLKHERDSVASAKRERAAAVARKKEAERDLNTAKDKLQHEQDRRANALAALRDIRAVVNTLSRDAGAHVGNALALAEMTDQAATARLTDNLGQYNAQLDRQGALRTAFDKTSPAFEQAVRALAGLLSGGAIA